MTERPDLYQWHVVGYATLGCLFCFYLNDWIDSHAHTFYILEYCGFMGIPAKLLYIIPAILNFLLLFIIFRTMKPTRTNTVTAPILVALTVSLTQFIAFLGFSMKAAHLPLVVVNVLIAGIVGFSAWTHYNILYLIPQITLEQAIREYETRVKVWGNLLQTVTLLLVSGGLGIILTLVSQFEMPILEPATKQLWPIGTAAILLYLAYGAYCVFLLRFLITTGELNDYIASREKDLKRTSGVVQTK